MNGFYLRMRMRRGNTTPPRIHLESHIPQMSPGQWGAIIEEAVKYMGGTRSCALKHKNEMGEKAVFYARVE